MEQNEDPASAIVREVEEELGVLPRELRQIGRIDLHKPPIGWIDYFVYAVTEWTGGEPKINDSENTELKWFTPREARRLSDMSLLGHFDLFDKAAGAL